MERYSRQIILPQIGEAGQAALARSRVAVVGAGGLGSPVLTYLAAAGVGALRIIDCDTVSLSNLNRQFLHTEAGLGRKKTQSAYERLRRQNPSLHLETADERLDEKNAQHLLGGADVVVDCVDNIAARLAVNEACLRMDLPLVEGGISGFHGFVTVVRRESACLACMGYDRQKERTGIPAVGAVAGVIGSLQASECLKLLLGVGRSLAGRILQYDALDGSFDEIAVRRRADCPLHARALQA